MGLLSSLGTRGNSRRKLIAVSRAEEERIRNILGIRELEPMPVQAARAFQLASDGNARLTDFIGVIETDEALSARIVRIANSVYYSRGTRVSDIEKAVANIGLDELRCLLSATMLKSLLHAQHPVREQIWANSVATAVLCRMLSSSVKELSPGAAFLCGLLHDVGKLVMIRRNGALYEKVNSLVSSSEGGFPDAEEQLFELSHIEVGQWIAQSWNFPTAVREAIAYHHQRPIPGSIDPAALVHIADTIAHSLGIGLPAHMRSFQRRAREETALLFPLLGFGETAYQALVSRFEQDFRDVYAQYQIDA